MGMIVSRAPCAALRPFVQLLWASDGAGPARGAREHVLPTGLAQLVLRLSPEPIVIVEQGQPLSLGHAVLGGARSGYYEKDVSAPSMAVGATLLPGAPSWLFGVGADELAERHTPLDALWGPEVERLRERLAAQRSGLTRIATLEACLVRRLPFARPLHAAVAASLARLHAGEERIGALVEASGYSHRALVVAFRAAVGLSPKAFASVLRFQRALRSLAGAPDASLVTAALHSGYSDQAHLTRTFAQMAGVSPARYRALGLDHPNHVPLAPIRGAPPEGQSPSRRARGARPS
jgi:AraC-like DNA-binding protein